MLVCSMYNKLTDMNWIKLYIKIHLKHWKDVTSAHLPSLSSSMKELILNLLEVNGAAMDASAFESAKPMFASFSAAQSLAPSPHIPTMLFFYFLIEDTSCDLCSGFIRA